MYSLTEEAIQVAHDKLVAWIRADERAEKLVEFYKIFGDELILAPASGKTYFHNAIPGGYIDHVVRVTETALTLASLYKKMGGVITFTKQELIFSALHHDLGKLGTEDGPYYVDQESDWHRKRGDLFGQNLNLQYFKVPERGLMMLQKYGIAITETEWLAIKLSDGIYDDGNKSYLINYAPYAMKTTLPAIIHWADHMASTVENDLGRPI